MNIIHQDGIFSEYALTILIYVVLLPIFLYAPLLLFIPTLIRAKSNGIFKFGNLLRKHNLDYIEKWIYSPETKDHRILGSMDNSSLADINGSYEPIREMKIIPIDFRLLVTSALLNSIPYIPLVFTNYTFREVIDFVIQFLVG